MQATTSQFTSYANAGVRPLSWRMLASFEKQYDPSIEFFTIGVSAIGGPDIIKGQEDVLQEWDLYNYTDFSDRVISLEVTRTEEPFSSITLARADIVLQNVDNYFTPNSGSPIDEFILPYRPMKIFGGFGDENLPLFVGLTDKMPVVDEASKTVQFQCVDFMYSLMNRPLDESIIYLNKGTDEIISGLLQLAGISPTQFNLDLGFNIIDVAYFEKGKKLGEALSYLMEAEQGRLYMDELGIIQFKNRQNISNIPSVYLDDSQIIELQTSQQDDVVNVVEIHSKVREVQAKQKIWELQGSDTIIPASGSIEIWADFDGPVTVVDTPQYITTATTSLFSTNILEDGTGATNSSAISVSFVKYATSYRMVFSNSSSTPTYLNALELWGRPVKVVKEIYTREVDQASIDAYDERPLVIENEFFNNESEATSKALILLGDYSQYGKINQLQIKGNPALQIGDAVSLDHKGDIHTAVITQITNRYAEGMFTQLIRISERDLQTYFTIGVSSIEGMDIIAP